MSFVLGVGPEKGRQPGANRNPFQKDFCQKAGASVVFQWGTPSDKQKWKESKNRLVEQSLNFCQLQRTQLTIELIQERHSFFSFLIFLFPSTTPPPHLILQGFNTDSDAREQSFFQCQRNQQSYAFLYPEAGLRWNGDGSWGEGRILNINPMQMFYYLRLDILIFKLSSCFKI